MWLFIHRPFEIWPALGTIRLERVYVVLTLIFWSVLYARKTWNSNRLNLSFSFFGIVFLASWATSSYQDAGSKAVEEYFKYVLFYVLLVLSVRDERDLKTVTLGYLVVLGLYMTHSFREFLCGRHVYRMGIPRMIGIDQTFSDPNTFAATILYSLPIVLAFWPLARARWQRYLLYYYAGLTVACIIFTGSRSGMAGLICFGAIALRRLYRKKLLLLLAVASLPLLWAIIPEHLQGRFRTIIDSGSGPENARQSAEGRSQGFYDGISLWQHHPVFGVGPAAHGSAMGHGAQAHNLYGQTLGEMGTMGALALLGVVAGFALNGVEIRRLARLDSSGLGAFPLDLSNAILITIALLLIKGWGDHNLYRYTWLWFGAFQSVAVNCMKVRVSTTFGHPGAPSEGRQLNVPTTF